MDLHEQSAARKIKYFLKKNAPLKNFLFKERNSRDLHNNFLRWYYKTELFLIKKFETHRCLMGKSFFIVWLTF